MQFTRLESPTALLPRRATTYDYLSERRKDIKIY